MVGGTWAVLCLSGVERRGAPPGLRGDRAIARASLTLRTRADRLVIRALGCVFNLLGLERRGAPYRRVDREVLRLASCTGRGRIELRFGPSGAACIRWDARIDVHQWTDAALLVAVHVQSSQDLEEVSEG